MPAAGLPQLDGRRIVVTGGAQGIGASAVRGLVREGSRVVSLDVRADGATVAEQADAGGPGSAAFLACDVSRRDQVEDAVATAARLLGGLDGLVHAAGVETRAAAAELTDEEWDRVVDVNLRGTFLTNQAAFPFLRDAGGGRILNFGSGAALEPFPRAAHYSAAKAGVMAWSRTVAHEWGAYGITVNAMVPAMWTPMYDATRAAMSPEQLAGHDAFLASRIAVGGALGDPDRDLLPVLVFLLGEGARFITGQLVAVDGGLTHVR